MPTIKIFKDWVLDHEHPVDNFDSARVDWVSSGPPPTFSGYRRLTSDYLVPAGQVHNFDPNVSTIVEVDAKNFIVEGTLQRHPANPGVFHILRWINVDENAYVGGEAAEPLSTDPGLWILGNGKLDDVGSAKLSWTRAAGALAAGATSLVTVDSPVGWRVGDELAIAPTLPPTVANHWDAYDYPKVLSISGFTVTLDRPLVFAHPAVTVATGKIMTAEIMNLTRNVRIESLPHDGYADDPLRKHMVGRAHIVFNHAMSPQVLKYVEIKNMGPQRPKDSDGDISIVLGRYPLHFHKMYDDSRGTLVEGLVARSLGSHGLVAHGSNGITFRSDIIHDGYAQGYWWDLVAGVPGEKIWANASHEVLYENCIGSRVVSVPDFRGGRNGMFTATGGTGNIARGCVAVGMGNAIDASGLHWPEGESVEADRYANPFGEPSGVWIFEVLPSLGYIFLSHNNRGDGFFVWQNTENIHPIPEGFISYYNGGFGWDHGAYGNPYQWVKPIYYANKAGSFSQRAMANNDTTVAQKQTDAILDQANLFPYCLVMNEHVLNSGSPQWIRPVFKNYLVAAVYVSDKDGQENWGRLIIQNPVFQGSGQDFLWHDAAHVDTFIRVTGHPTLGNFTLRHKNSTVPGGVFIPAWNCKKY